jgi:hypothetical protein
MTDKPNPILDRGTWVILELFGHKVVAGLLTKDESLGAPLIRMDIPETTGYPEFTRHYHPNAIYSVSYVSEETARLTAEELQENPVSVYVPDLGDLNRLRKENETYHIQIERLTRAMRQLPDNNSIRDD